MSDAEFTIRLAPGLYIDSLGRFISGPLDQVPTHPAPGGGLPIDPNAVKKALSGIADALPKTGDPKSSKALTDLGVPNELINALGKIGEIAGSLAKIVPYVAIALEVGKLLGLFKSGKDPLLEAIEALFDEVKNLIQAKDEKWTAHEVFTLRQTILRGLDAVAEFQDDLKYGPDPDDLEDKLDAMREIHQEVVKALSDLMSPSLWQSSLDGEDFKWVWAANLFFDPGPGDPGPDSRAYRPAGEVERFDHRVMAPTVCAMTQSYLTFIKQIVPEYRSSGEYDTFIASITLLIEKLANQMRAQTLARTHWSASDFLYLYPTNSNPLLGGPYQPSYAGFHVGALDLRSSTVPSPPNVPYGFNWIFDHSGAQVHWGAMHFNWSPPAQVQLEDWGELGARFRVLNPDECAAAANALSEELYAKVLYSSGYFSLVHLAGLLRHMYTAPSRSETVTGAVAPHRQPLPRKQVTVTGVDVFPFAPATSSAEREPQTSFIRANLNTQPRDRDRRFDYQVWLRALPAQLDGTSDYATVYRTYYENEPQPKEPGTAPFSRLVCEFNASGVLDGEKLVAGKTPEQIVQVGAKTVSLTADTFDWWIPIPEKVESLLQLSDYFNKIRELGWLAQKGGGTGNGTTPEPPKRAPGKWADLDLVRAVVDSPSAIVGTDFIQAPSPAPVGERREVQRKEIEVTCTVIWNGIDLTVRIEGRPEDRNYDLFLVVEEHLPDHDQWLHTAFAIPVTGQLTFVPQKFFDEEQQLIEQANEFWGDFNDEYAESVEISPLDPVAQINWRERYSVEGLRRIASIVRSEQPEVLAAFMRTRGLELREEDRVETRAARRRTGTSRRSRS